MHRSKSVTLTLQSATSVRPVSPEYLPLTQSKHVEIPHAVAHTSGFSLATVPTALEYLPLRQAVMEWNDGTCSIKYNYSTIVPVSMDSFYTLS